MLLWMISPGSFELIVNRVVSIKTLDVGQNRQISKARYQAMLETANQMGADQLTEWANSKYITLKAEYDQIKDNEE